MVLQHFLQEVIHNDANYNTEGTVLQSPAMIEASPTSSLTTILISAGVGAVVTGFATLIHGVLERRARAEEAERERKARVQELLMTAAVDISKEWAQSVEYPIKAMNSILTLEMRVIQIVNRILREVFETGKISPESDAVLKALRAKPPDQPASTSS